MYSSACLHRGLGFGEQRVLASFNEKLCALHRRILQNAVSEIQDVSFAAKRGNGIESRGANLLRRSKKHSRIDVTLKRDLGPDLLTKLGQIHAPIHAQNICA